MKEIKEFKYTNAILLKLISTTELLGKLNILIAKMTNPYILTYILESVDALNSNEIENIHSTYDEAALDIIINNKSSDYLRYRKTLKQAHKRLVSSEIIRVKDIQWINFSLRGVDECFRKLPVTIKDNKGNIIHYGVDANKVPILMGELIKEINEESNINPIIKSLLIHHKFEEIHPFNDGNGRTGRIIFALLINKYNVLEIPASVFSYSVFKNKSDYYKALHKADEGNYNFYLLTMLEIFNHSLEVSINFIEELNQKIKLISDFNEIKENRKLEKVLIATFSGIKVTTKYIAKKLDMNQKTVKKYLDILVNLNILKQEVIGKYRPYKNLIIEKLVNDYFI